jgi:hypothetical protein
MPEGIGLGEGESDWVEILLLKTEISTNRKLVSSGVSNAQTRP